MTTRVTPSPDSQSAIAGDDRTHFQPGTGRPPGRQGLGEQLEVGASVWGGEVVEARGLQQAAQHLAQLEGRGNQTGGTDLLAGSRNVAQDLQNWRHALHPV